MSVNPQAEKVVELLKEKPKLLGDVVRLLKDVVIIGPWESYPGSDEDPLCPHAAGWGRVFLFRTPEGQLVDPDNLPNAAIIEGWGSDAEEWRIPKLHVRCYPDFAHTRASTHQHGKDIADQRLEALGYLLL